MNKKIFNLSNKSKKIPQSDNSFYSYTYLFILFLSLVAFNPAILDFTHVSRFAVLSFGFLVLLLFLIRRKVVDTFSINIFHITLFLYFIITLLSITWALNKSEALFESGKSFLFLLTFLIANYFLTTIVDFESKLIKTIIASIILFIIFGIAQLIKLNSIDLNHVYSITSLSGHKNLFSCFLFISLSFSAYGIIYFNSYWKWICYGTLFIALFFILILQTRSIWISIAISYSLFFLLFLLKWKLSVKQFSVSKFIYLIVSMVILLSGMVLFIYLKGDMGQLKSRFDLTSYSQSETGIERLRIWNKTILLIKDNPWAGVGAGNWQLEYGKYGVDDIPSVAFNNHTFQRPHNDFLWIMSETGVVGIFSYLLFFLLAIVFGFQNFLKQTLSKESVITLLFSITLLGFLIFSFFDFPKERVEFIILSAIMVSILNSRNRQSLNVYSVKIASSYIPLVVLSILLLSMNLIISYHRFKGEFNMKKVYKYKNGQNSSAAIKFCNKASSVFYTIDPTSIPVSWYRGLAYFSMGNNEKAFKDFFKASKESPYNPHILNNLGSGYEVLGNHDKAKECYMEALRLNKYFDDPKLNLAAILYNEKKYQEAYIWTLKANENLPRRKEYIKVIEPFVKKP